MYSIRHPATGYVQGMNDLVTPFFYVFISDIIGPDKVMGFSIGKLSQLQTHHDL